METHGPVIYAIPILLERQSINLQIIIITIYKKLFKL